MSVFEIREKKIREYKGLNIKIFYLAYFIFSNLNLRK